MKKEDVKKIKKTLGFALFILGLLNGSLETLVFMDNALGAVIFVAGFGTLGVCVGDYLGGLYIQNELKAKDNVLGFISLSLGMIVGIAACHYLALGAVIALLGIGVSVKILTDAPLKVSLSVVKKDLKELSEG